MKAKSPTAVWYTTLKATDKEMFSSVRNAFELHWPVKAITEKTIAEKQAMLDEAILKASDLGKRVAASVGTEEELSHIVWADKVERLAGDIPDTNNLLVASTRKRLPRPVIKLIGLKPMTWKQLADTVRDITLEELMEKSGRGKKSNLICTSDTKHTLKSAQSGIPGHKHNQQIRTIPQPTFSTEKPAHERLADILNRALPIHPRNAEGIAKYNEQVLLWQTSYGQNGKGLNKIRPYPLTPGTIPVASGECWRCGHRTHHPAPCPAPTVPTLETKWQSIAQTICKQAEAAVVPATSVNLVTKESDEVHTYDMHKLEYLQQLVNQGKGEGSSM